MATKSSIHIKSCNVKSSGAHNRRTAEYMRNIGESKIYIVPELSADNEQWINPGFGNPDLQAHYDYIKQMVKEKTGRAMQEKERERKGKNGKIIKVAGCSPIREGVLLIRPDTTLADVRKFGEECQQLGASLRFKSSCTRTRGIGWADSPKLRTRRVSKSMASGSNRITMHTSYLIG